MSLWSNFLDGFIGRRPDPEPIRAELDAQQSNIAGRLSRLTGRKRDDVLAEAYRRADAIMLERRKGERRKVERRKL